MVMLNGHEVNIIATICARGGSKGVPKKNIRPLLDKPLIVYTIEKAKKCTFFDRIIVSTDDPIIARISKEHGVEVPFLRPKELATDTASKIPVLQHIIDHLEKNENYSPDIIVDLDVTAPFRTVEDIEKCVIKLLDNSEADCVETIYEGTHNPYYNIVEVNKQGYLFYSKSLEKEIHRRQDAPKTYFENGSVVAFRNGVIKNKGTIFTDKLLGVIIPAERGIMIDNELDFIIAELLLKENKVD